MARRNAIYVLVDPLRKGYARHPRRPRPLSSMTTFVSAVGAAVVRGGVVNNQKGKGKAVSFKPFLEEFRKELANTP